MRRSTNLATGVAAASVAALTGVIVTTGHDTDHAKPASRTTPAAAVAHVGDPDDAATWILPVQAYMPTSHQARTVAGSRDELMKACMTKAGFPHWRPSPDFPALGGTNDRDARYVDWSACMDGKGCPYAKPMDANDDGTWWRSDTAAAREKAVAVTDVRCRDKYHVERVWFDTEAGLPCTTSIT
ncbi:hypothetical protein AQI88_39525 [Streptomyces cellostaticus]|uniref:Uncharacterized protein n=1 Tax=Streptomyces cellostaticus TaxID=67285 RepID=A0A124HB02_9ACTN|nr:hypothetical protein [Streptomyces cellostaticus]KUM89752.1 hypothetical protein AQI88_39525 [Streptomyces cellostaticus]GHI10216.1 hypothetical protein Scel_85370 [Streptomyces cellostaticus]